MPPAPSAKPARASTAAAYGMTKKRSASSPYAASSSTSKAKAAPAVQRRTEEPTYYEEDYDSEIRRYMSEMDTATLASADLMDMQPELQWFMRPYLIDFIIEVHQQFRLRPEVLYLAMNIVDRYVSKRVVYKKHYQLVGCAALWIAAKFEDGKDKVPLVRELAEMCCKAYDESAFIQMEGHVLSTIGWVLGHPSAEAWLRNYTLGRSPEDIKVQNTARFLMELTLFHREFVGIRSNNIAGGALILARQICGKPRKHYLQTENVAVRVAMAIDKHLGERLENVSDIVIRKYAPMYYSRASAVVREWYLSGRRLVLTPDAPATPISGGLATPGLVHSSSWANKRNSWVSSPAVSCASSDAGDESPLTPITPLHTHVADPFSVASKENIAPVYASSPAAAAAAAAAVVGAQSQKDLTMLKATVGGAHPITVTYPSRPVLHALPSVSDLSLPHARGMRRLSN